ncbi:MAG: DUF2851 family protein [Bacteriovoracaceae bacterium]
MHEDLLRHLWSKQMFDTTRLVTTDGLTLHILDAGTLSRTSGPDFRNARLQIDGTVYTGDIEFHRNIEDWELHNHQYDRNYNSVILHVVLLGKARPTQSESGRIIPTIILEPFLSASVTDIGDHLSREEYSSRHRQIPCAPNNDVVQTEILQYWIRTLYRERLQEKINRMHERLDHIIVDLQRTINEPQDHYAPNNEDFPILTGTFDNSQYNQRIAWEQLLYEEVMDCLGYSNNRQPMKLLAERVSVFRLSELLRTSLKGGTNEILPNTHHIEALLFRTSDLLPAIDETDDIDSKVYIHSLYAAWKELHTPFSVPPLQQSDWNFSPTRPGNFPTIRLAAASVFVFNLLQRSLFRSIITVIEGRYSSLQSKINQLTVLLDAGDHSYWNYHYSFTEATHKKHSVLGAARINDIIVNTIIPFVCLYGAIFRNELLVEQCLNIATELPLLEDNSILRTMKSQLVKARIPLSFAFQQQGLLQLYKRYCVANGCSECRIGKEVFPR